MPKPKKIQHENLRFPEESPFARRLSKYIDRRQREAPGAAFLSRSSILAELVSKGLDAAEGASS
jgi:hypothetical protein